VKQSPSEAEIAASSEAAILDDAALLNHASLRSRNLRQFSLSLLITCTGTTHLKTLDVSHNELFELPGQTTKLEYVTESAL
jgi:Leucine-rich repeat (LRR) protein